MIVLAWWSCLYQEVPLESQLEPPLGETYSKRSPSLQLHIQVISLDDARHSHERL